MQRPDKAAALLKARGIWPSVIQLPTLQPLPQGFLGELLLRQGPLLTVEEHVASGGLGQRVAMALAESGAGKAFRALSAPAVYPEACLDREELLRWA